VELDDPRLAPFCDLTRAVARDTVVIEGELALRRALAAGAAIHTVVCTPAHAARMTLPSAIDLVVAEPPELARLTGFAFHRGVLAAMPRPRATFDVAILERDRCTIVVAAGLADPANVGAIVRTAHAFAVDLVVTDTDPYTRKAIRSSAGHVFAQPVLHEPTLDATITTLARTTEIVATTASGTTSLADYTRPPRLTLLLGSEANGLPPALLDLAHTRLRIPTRASLNVATAAAILLWQLRAD
jgi:TrmH family RNA methyltransferase